MNQAHLTSDFRRKTTLFKLVLVLLVGSLVCSCRKQATPPATSPPPVLEPAPVTTPEPTAERNPDASPSPARKSSGEPANPKEVRAAFDKYSKNIGGPPGSWEELIEGKLLKGVPMGKDGKPLDFTAYQEYLGRGGK